MGCCAICGRMDHIRTYHTLRGVICDITLCDKHVGQYYRFGHFTDTIQRSNNDLNEVVSINDVSANIYLYNQKCIKIAEAIIDLDDVDKVSKYKWRTSCKSGKQYVVTGTDKNQIYLARFVLNYDGPDDVDHINGNTLDNRKQNLRIVSHSNNLKNMKPKSSCKTGFRGVSFSIRDKKYKVDFIINGKRFYFKQFDNLCDAVFIRYYCELQLNKNRYTVNDQHIKECISELTDDQKSILRNYAATIISKGAI